MSIKIDKGVAIPAGRAGKYPLASMEIGDSFFVASRVESARRAAVAWGKRHGRTFVSKAIDGGVRVWRVA